MTSTTQKQKAFRNVIEYVEQKIQRPLAAYEMAGIGLVMQKTLQEDVIPNAQSLFDLSSEDTAAIVARKVNEHVYSAVQAEITERKAQGEHTEAMERINDFLHTTAQTTYERHEVCQLGTAQLEWLASEFQEPVRSAMMQE